MDSYTIRKKYLDACKKCNNTGYLENMEECECSKKATIEIKMRASNIPSLYMDMSFENFHDQELVELKKVKKYVDKFEEMKKDGIGIYFQGPSGTGKTLFLCCIIRGVIEKGYFGYYEYMGDIIDNIINLPFDEKEEYKDNISTYSLMAIDEIDKKITSEKKVAETIFSDLIRHRLSNNLPTLLSSNCPINKLESLYDKSLVSTIREKLVPITLVSDDYRENLAKQISKRLNP
jgi:DNA replication protein DnaC